MVVVKIFKESAGKINLTSVVTFQSCKRRLKLYFSDLEKVRQRIISGEIVDTPYLTLQRDRRIDFKGVEKERRSTQV